MLDQKDLFDLHGRLAVVIGAGSGIGRAGACALATYGARVICADLDGDRAQRTTHAIQQSGGDAMAKILDVRNPGDLADLVNSFPIPDILVVTPAVNSRRRLTDATDADFERIIDVNLRGTFNAVRAYGAHMAENSRGSIITVSSIRHQVVEPGQGIYAATKAAVVQLTRTLAAELGARGVRANTIVPGIVDTPLAGPIHDDPAWREAYAERNALGRWAHPDELGGAVVFLASDASSYVTGSCLVVDGGWLAIDGRYTPEL